MSFSIGAFANGLAGATDRIVLQQKEAAQLKRQQEEQEYNRKRQAVADEQAAQLHDQNVQKNEILLNNGLREQAEQQRVDGLKSKIGILQGFKSRGDTKGAFDDAISYMNSTNENNPTWNQDHTISYTIDPENPNTATINVIDKNTGNFIKQINQYANTDTLIDMIYSQIDPVKDYENAAAGKAKLAEETRKNAFELEKMGIQSGYKLDELTHKGKIDEVLQNGRFQNSYTLEGIRQQGAYDREQLKQDNANYRSDNKANGSGGSLGEGKTVKGVEGNVQGALSYARKNAQQLQFLTNNPVLHQKTLAMMAIESGGNANVHSYDNSSYGLMQLNKKYAHGFARQFNISGDPLSDPQTNLRTGAALIQHLDKKYQGNNDLIAAAYNAGEPRIDAALKAWNKGGRKGTWFDYLNINEADRQQVLGHVIKYNQALSLIGNQDNTQPQQAKDSYVRTSSGKATDSIKAISANMTNELGYEGKNNAAVIGGLSGLQPKIVKFTSDPTYKGRFDAYQDILTLVQRVVDRSPMRATMSVQERNEYVHQKAAEMIGAKDKIEVGQWIQQGSRPQQRQQTAAASSIDFSQFSLGDSKPKTDNNQKTSAPPKYLTTVPNNAPKPSNQTKVIDNPFQLSNRFRDGFK